MAVTRQTEPWSALLEAGRSDDRLVREAYEGARAPVFARAPGRPASDGVQGLANAGIDQLYSHQAQALQHAWEATTIVTTGTASGKSLCFNLPTLEVLCTDAKARALYLYPTKALAQDQARALNAFGLPKQVRPAIYDGDTKREERLAIRRRSNLVLTNPDMLHVGILPNHAAWADFFANLAVVVVDEAHVYRGVFGAQSATSCAGCGASPPPTRRRRASARQRDDRQPRRAGRAPDRLRGRAPRRRGRLAGRAPPDRDVEPARGRRGAAAARAAR